MTNVLVVDDNEQVLSMFGALLERHGYGVRTAANGAEALKSAREESPDLIVSDILMPVMDGFALCREWKADERLKGVPFVFCTATYTDAKDEELAQRLGADRFIAKPVKPRAFITALREVLARRGARAVSAAREPSADEIGQLKEYNEALVRKLEAKVTRLEEANRVLARHDAEVSSLETHMRRAQQEWREVFEALGHPAFVLSPDHGVIAANEAMVRATGRSRDELLGMNCWEVMHGSDAIGPPRGCPMERLGDDGAACVGDMEVEALGGTYLVSCTPVFDESGDLDRVIHIATDITARKRSEEATSQRVREMSVLHALGKRANASLSLDEVVGAALDDIHEAVGTDLSLLFLRDGNELILQRQDARDPECGHAQTPAHRVGKCLCGLAAAQETAVYSLDISKDPRCTWKECKEAGVRSFAALPLHGRGGLLGVLGLASRERRDFADNATFLETAADEIAIGVQNALLHGELEAHAAKLSAANENLRTEIEERRRTEASLRESEARWRSLTESSPDHILLLDREGRIQFANQTVPDLTPEQVTGKRIHEFSQPEQAARVKACVEGVLETGIPDRFDGEYHAPDGTIHVFDARVAPIIRDDQVVAATVTATDITERTRAEESIRRQAEIIEQSPFSIIATDLQGRITNWNSGAERMFGYAGDHATGQHVAMLYREEDRGVLERDVLAPLTERGFHEIEVRLRRESGEHFIGYLSLWMLRDADGTPIGMVGYTTDISERIAVQRELREREALLAEMSSIAHIGGWEFDPATGAGTWTPEVARIHDLDPNAEASTEFGLTFYHGESRQLIESAVREAAEQGKPYDLELEMISANGTHKWVRTIGRVEKDGGRVTRVRGTFQDITDRKRSEEALRESEERFRAIFEQAAVGVAQIETATGRFMRVNQKYRDIVGFDTDDLAASTFMDITHPDDLQEDLANMERLKAGELRTFSIEKRYIRPDGSIVWVNLTVSPMWPEGAEPDYHIAVVEDITARKKAEEDRERLAAILEATPDFVGSTTPDGKVLYLNAGARRMVGFTADEDISTHTIPDHSPEWATKIILGTGIPAAIRDGIWVGDTAMRNRDGREIPVSQVILAHRDRVGQLTHLSTIARDMTERRLMEEAIRESERQMATMISNLPGFVYRCDHSSDWRMRFISDGCLDVTGYTPAELIDNAFTSYGGVIYEEDRARVRRDIVARVEEHEPFQLEYRIKTKTGRIRWVWEHGCAVYDEGGEVQLLEGYISDVTERKRAEDELRERESRYAIAEQLAHVGSWDWDISTGNIHWSDEIYRIFGLDPEQFTPRIESVMEHFHPDDRERDRDLVERATASRVPFSFESRIIRPDGAVRTLVSTVAPRFDVQGGLMRLTGSVHDITERKESATKLEAHSRFLETLIEVIPAAVFWKDRAGVYLGCNGTCCEWLGVSPDALVGRTVHEIYPEDLAAIYERADRELFDNPGRQVYEARLGGRSGAHRDVLFQKATYRDPGGEVAGIVGVATDISDIRRTREELARHRDRLEELVAERTAELEAALAELIQKERLATLGQLTATVAHELRNPLGTIRTSFFALRERLQAQSDDHDVVFTRVDRNIMRCDRIIEELLDYARTRPLRTRITRVDDWLATVVEEQPLPEHVTIQRDFSGGGVADIDRERFRRVIVNLMQNAAAAVVESQSGAGTITVGTRVHTGRVEIRIQDTGPGIPDSDLPKVFEPLFSTRTYGVGLGLPIVRQITEQHGGEVSIESREGFGTVVTVCLPIVDTEKV